MPHARGMGEEEAAMSHQSFEVIVYKIQVTKANGQLTDAGNTEGMSFSSKTPVSMVGHARYLYRPTKASS